MRFQLVIDCADPDRLARFWTPCWRMSCAGPADSLPDDFTHELGVPEEELVDGAQDQRLEAHGPNIGFHVVPDAKAAKPATSTSTPVANGWTRSRLAGSESTQRPARCAGLGATITGALSEEGSTTTRSG